MQTDPTIDTLDDTPPPKPPRRTILFASVTSEEQGLLDGDLPHAIERVLSTAVVAAGFKLDDVGGLEEETRASPPDGRNAPTAIA